MTAINPTAIPGFKSQIDAAVAKEHGIPGVQYYAVNKNGEYIFSHTAGKVGLGVDKPMGDDNVFWMASCTKLITAVACMQLVERGELALDDVAQVERLAPELKAVKVLEDDGSLVEKNRGITLRMLLNHTAGFSYSFGSEKLKKHFEPIGVYELSGKAEDYLTQPLVNQPGEKFEYGINMDWVGVLIMRVSGLSLHDYFQKNITGPLGIEQDISFLPNSQMKQDLAYCHFRDSKGKLILREDGHMFRSPLTISTPEEGQRLFQAGGAGTYARPRAYCQIIATLLNDGLHASTGNRILKKETVDAMFTNQVPDMPDFAREPTVASKSEYMNNAPELYPEPGNPPQGWGLSFFLHLTDSAIHSMGTAWWGGLPNLFWWCDRTKGIGGIIATQIVPFGDLEVIGLWAGIEAGLYQSLV